MLSANCRPRSSICTRAHRRAAHSARRHRRCVRPANARWVCRSRVERPGPRRPDDTPSDFSLRCSAERSMPMNAAVREMLPPKRLICASRYSRSKISRASRSGSEMIRSVLAALRPTAKPAPLKSDGKQVGRNRFGGVVGGEDQQPLHDVAQLAHIARPVIGLQHRHRLVAQCRAWAGPMPPTAAS